jgi:hypothetical protein
MPASIVERDDVAVDAAELPFLAGEIPLRGVEELHELVVVTRDARDRQPRALPEVVMVDLRHGRTKTLLQLGFRRFHELPLPLQRPRLGEVQLGGEDADVARAHAGIEPRADFVV